MIDHPRFEYRLARAAMFSIDKGLGLPRRRPWVFINRVGISRWLMLELLQKTHELARRHHVAPRILACWHVLFEIDRRRRLALN